MKTAGLRRTLKKGWACAAVAAFAGLAVLPVSAEVANPNLIPADSAYVISVPNSTTFWSAWEANGLYEAFTKIMAMDDVAEKTEEVKRQIRIVEASLGFKLDGASLSQIFSSMDIYALPITEPGKVEGVAILTVADADKTSKLLDLAEKAAIRSAEGESETTGTEVANSDGATTIVTTADHNGVTIKQFRNEDGEVKFAYARPENLLVMAADEGSLHQLIDRVKAGAATSGTLAASENYQRVQQALQSEQGELYLYGDAESASSRSFAAMDDVSAGLRSSIESLMKSMQPTKFYGASIKIAPKEIYSYSYGILRDDASDSMAARFPGTEPLGVATYIPENSVWAAATSLVDVDSIAEVVSEAASSNSGDQLTQQMRTAEAGMGFSVKDDLVPALGNEFAFNLQNVEITGLIPSVDVTIIMGVKDRARMTKVVEGVERMANMVAAANSSSDDSTTGTPGFKTEEAHGQTIKYMEMQGLASFSPGYVLTDDYLILGSTKTAMSNALGVKNDGKNLVDGNALKRLGHGIDGRGNAVYYLDMAKVIDLGRQVSQMLPAARPMARYLDAANVLDAVGGTSRVEEGAAVSRGVLKLK